VVDIAKQIFNFGGTLHALFVSLSHEIPQFPLEHDGHDETNGNNTDIHHRLKRKRERERERERKTQQLGLNHGKTDVIGWISQIPRTTMMSMTQCIIHRWVFLYPTHPPRSDFFTGVSMM